MGTRKSGDIAHKKLGFGTPFNNRRVSFHDDLRIHSPLNESNRNAISPVAHFIFPLSSFNLRSPRARRPETCPLRTTGTPRTNREPTSPRCGHGLTPAPPVSRNTPPGALHHDDGASYHFDSHSIRLRMHPRRAVGPPEQLVGLIVAGDLLFFGVPFQRAAELEREVRHDAGG